MRKVLLGCSGDAPAGTQMKSIIMSAIDGTILQTFTQLGGADEVWYSPAGRRLAMDFHQQGVLWVWLHYGGKFGNVVD